MAIIITYTGSRFKVMLAVKAEICFRLFTESVKGIVVQTIDNISNQITSVTEGMMVEWGNNNNKGAAMVSNTNPLDSSIKLRAIAGNSATNFLLITENSAESIAVKMPRIIPQ